MCQHFFEALNVYLIGSRGLFRLRVKQEMSNNQEEIICRNKGKSLYTEYSNIYFIKKIGYIVFKR